MRILPKRGGLTLPNQQEARLRVMVILGTLLVAAFIGLRSESRLAKLPGMAVIGLLGLIVLLRYLPWGVIALVPVSFAVNIRLGTGTSVALNATFLLVIALIGVWVLRMLVIERHLRLVSTPANLPALLFIGAGLLSWLTSFLPWLPLATGRPSLPAQAGAFLIYALSIGGMLLVINTLTNRRLVETFTWVYIGVGLVYFLIDASSWAGSIEEKWLVGAQHGGAVFFILLTSMTLGQALFNRSLTIWIRGGLFAAASLVIAHQLFVRSDWISGWLPPLIAALILIWLRDWRIGTAMTIIGSATVLPVFLRFFNTQVNTETQQWSSLTRFETWPIILKLLKANPITGLGPAVYPFLTSLYFYLGYFVAFNTHNNFFDIALQMGLIGIGLFTWLAAVIYWQGWRLRQQSRDGFTQGYVNGLLAAFTAALISGGFADWFLPFVYNIGIPGFQASVYLWLFCGGMFSLAVLNQKQGENERSAA